MSPDGQVTTGDNEGTFVPRCPINWVEPDDFLGVVDSYENRVSEPQPLWKSVEVVESRPGIARGAKAPRLASQGSRQLWRRTGMGHQ